MLVMGRKKRCEIKDFYNAYIIQKLDDSQLMLNFNLKKPTLILYKSQANKMKNHLQTEISTGFLEHELLDMYQNTILDQESKLDVLKFMIDIWKNKAKVPNSKTDKEDDKLDEFLSKASHQTPSDLQSTGN